NSIFILHPATHIFFSSIGKHIPIVVDLVLRITSNYKRVAFAKVKFVFFSTTTHGIKQVIIEFELREKQVFTIRKRIFHQYFTVFKNRSIKSNGFFYFHGFFVSEKQGRNNGLWMVYSINIQLPIHSVFVLHPSVLFAPIIFV